ncbi:MAG: monovalent cation/H+ antiporter subunit D [Rhodobacteraceae bacterium]|jgi:multicomponent K+:H+ antiporter subunit D|nr:monovalent cation/H+ antiporter subunit D [Paracoccaceae bacterium]
MSHWIVAPIVLPALLAPFIVLALRRDLVLQRVFSVAGTLALGGIAAALVAAAAGGGIEVYALGDWPAPFGIVLVLDRLSALMVLLTALLALAVVLYAIGSGWDARGRHFHALFQFQLMGVCGAFLTGDIFNLFVFFEVLLIASYGLMIHGGGERRLRAGVQYVLFNLAGSTLFLFALGTVYALTGTLNMADLAVRVASLPAGEDALIRVAAVLLLLVFAVKAALVPLHFWMPGTYAAAPAPVAALFAILSKVGAYAILRVYTLVFGPEAVTGALVADVLLPAALVTLVVGTIGVMGARQAGMLAAFAGVASMGTLLAAIGLFTQQATAAALFYLVHSTFATAALFLVVDMVESRRPEGGRLEVAPPMAQSGLVAAMFFAAAIAVAGMPPLSGFLGKLLVLDAARMSAAMVPVWATVLATSLVAVVAFSRAGSLLFWKAHESGAEVPDLPSGRATALPVAAALGLIGALAGLTVLAGPVSAYLGDTAAQLYAPQAYIEAVLAPAAPPAAGE